MTVSVKTSSGSYDIVLQRGALAHISSLLHLNRRVLVVTDSGVPQDYAQTVANACKQASIVTIEQGEQSKTLDTWQTLLQTMVQQNFTRTDCVVAVGGGVVGDLSGFAAASYMRGIDFYNIPTTVLSQVDSSIGGKTAVDFMGLKNLVGAFYPPKKVVIDPDTLTTLPPRQRANGFAEALKMATTHDADLFEQMEHMNPADDSIWDTVIERALLIKKSVVEADEHESGLRKVLNFGHTLAHAIESVNGMDTYYHGECVGLGMLPMCSDTVRARLMTILKRWQLPVEVGASKQDLIEACRHDKKTAGDTITLVTVPAVGSFELKTMPFEDFEKLVNTL